MSKEYQRQWRKRKHFEQHILDSSENEFEPVNETVNIDADPRNVCENRRNEIPSEDAGDYSDNNSNFFSGSGGGSSDDGHHDGDDYKDDVPQEKGATYLREFAGNSHNFPTTFPKLSRNFPETFPHLPTTIPTKFPNLTTRNFPDPATRNLHLPIPARGYIRDIRDLKISKKRMLSIFERFSFLF